MDPLFNEVGIYSALGQRYDPVDSDLVLKYREAIDGQVLEEGITEAGSAAGSRPPATSYATHGFPMIPFYIFYSMFGFQRTGDQLWALGDARGARIPHGRHGRPDDAHRRGPPARRRPQPRPRDDHPAVPGLRPDLRLRAGRDHPRRHRADARRRARTSSTTSRSTTRTTRRRPSPRASTRGSSAGIYRLPRQVGARPGRRAPAGAARRVGLDPPAGARRPGAARREVRHRRRGVLGAVVPAAPPRRARGRALEPAPPGREAAGPVRRDRPRRRTAARSSPRPTG